MNNSAQAENFQRSAVESVCLSWACRIKGKKPKSSKQNFMLSSQCNGYPYQHHSHSYHPQAHFPFTETYITRYSPSTQEHHGNGNEVGDPYSNTGIPDNNKWNNERKGGEKDQ